jgi:hypothetical protein
VEWFAQVHCTGYHCQKLAVLGTDRCWDHLQATAQSIVAALADAGDAVSVDGSELSAAQADEMSNAIRAAPATVVVSAVATLFVGEVDLGPFSAKRLNLERARFEGSLTLDGVDAGINLWYATISDRLWLDGPTGAVSLQGAKVGGQLLIDPYDGPSLIGRELVVAGTATLNHVCSPSTDLSGATFEKSLLIRASGDLDMSGCNTAKQATIGWFVDAAPDCPTSPCLNLADSVFGAGVVISWGPGDLLVQGARFGGASVVDRASDSPAPPRLSSALNLDAAELALRDVDISKTLFAGAVNLGKVSELDPDRLPSFQRLPLMVARPILYDEEIYRGRDRDDRVDDPRYTLPRSKARLEESYRSIRKALEDAGNGPSANDLYFAERYWRRRRLSGVAKIPLLVYEAIAGHGVRPLRSLVTLALVVVAAAAAFDQVGELSERRTVGTPTKNVSALCELQPRVTTVNAQATVLCQTDFDESLTYAVRSASAFLRPSTAFELQGVAILIDVLLRITAPALFALFVLSLRSRIVR